MRYIFRGDELTDTVIAKYIDKHKSGADEIKESYRYYFGEKTADGSVRPAKGRANNKLNTNLAKYITDTATGYFVGVPPVYAFSDNKASRLKEVFDANDETALNYEIAENMSIAGIGYDLVYIDAEKRVRIAAVDPRGAFTIHDDAIDTRMLAGVRYWKNKDKTFGEVYLPGVTKSFEYKSKNIAILDEVPTPFSEPNLTEYPNNRFFKGDYTCVKNNINGYNLALSNMANDLENTANAYLVLKGFEQPDDETKETLRKDKVLGLPLDAGAEYITKNLNDDAYQNHRKALKEDILQVAGVPDLSDQSFASSSSGIALRYKLWGIDQLFSKKKQSFDRALFRRMRLIAEALRVVESVDIGDVSKSVTVKFTRNMPKDISGEVDNAVKLSGMVSEKTLYETLEPITGITAEDEKTRVAESGGGYGNTPFRV